MHRQVLGVADDAALARSVRARPSLLRSFLLIPMLLCLPLVVGTPVALLASGQDVARETSARYWPRDEVFGGAALLFNSDDTPVHQIYGIGWERPGPVEVHARDTDVIFVFEGGATVVTGGEVLEPRSPREHETLGSGIRGGTRQTLGPGDVMIIPAGTPHWFESVDGAIDFVAVKVRETLSSPQPVRWWSGIELPGTGPLLFDAREEGGNYQIFSVGRNGPGMAEVHDAARDIILVTEGAASFVTDGSIVEPRRPRPGETVGSGVREGTTHDLSPGDVTSVPQLTPHWFQAVDDEIEYLVVKFVF